jgi:hypothetical protein
MTQEAMKQALEALEFFSDTSNSAMDKAVSEDAITSLRQAIAELESQEPVAWVQDVEFEQLPEFAFSWVKTRLHDKPLYTHPPQRKLLTVEEIAKLDCYDHFKFARAIEAAHGIKE